MEAEHNDLCSASLIIKTMKKKIDWIWMVALVIFPFVLWIMPTDYFDNGELILCPSRAIFDIECFGCGMTRAIMHVHHFNFVEGFYYNYLSFLVYPALVFIWFKWLSAVLKRLQLMPQKFLKKSAED